MQRMSTVMSRNKEMRKTNGASRAGAAEDSETHSSGAEEPIGYWNALEETSSNDNSRSSSGSAPKAAERTPSERTQRRRDINRENARKSRMRKREKQMRLQVQNERLQNENARLTQALVSILQCMSKQQLQRTGVSSTTDVTEADIQQWMQQGGMPACRQLKEERPKADMRQLQTPLEKVESKTRGTIERSETNQSSNGSDPQSVTSSSNGASQSGDHTAHNAGSAVKKSHSKRRRSSFQDATDGEILQKTHRPAVELNQDAPSSFSGPFHSENRSSIDLSAYEQAGRHADQPTFKTEDQKDVDDLLFGKEKEDGRDSLYALPSMNPFDTSSTLGNHLDERSLELGEMTDCNDATDEGLPFLPLGHT